MSNKQDPASKINLITAGANDFTFPCDAILVGGAGTITLESSAGDVETITVVGGQVVPLQCKKVTAATATALFALGH